MKTMTFKEELALKTKEVEKIIEQFYPEERGEHKLVMEAMNYSLRVGGKRLRPLIMQETYKVCGGNGNLIQPFMAAMEMIHTYSLVHDDLPAMDGDEYRRGMQSTWKKYGEGMGVLTGDALLNYAYETSMQSLIMVSDTYNKTSSDSDPEYYVKALEKVHIAYQNIYMAQSVLMHKAGISGMIGGQVVDVLHDGKPMTAAQLDFVFQLKTCALIEASFMIGAILAGADPILIDSFETIGRNVGMAFQIQDDILDVIGDAKELGKPIGSDEKNEKTTYVKLYGLENAKAKVEEYSNAAISELEELKNSGSVFGTLFLEQLIESLIKRTK